MDQQQLTKLQEIIDNGYDFRFGEYFSRGFEIIQKNISGYILFAVVYFAASYILGRIPTVGDIVLSIIVSPCLMAGMYMVSNRLDQDMPTEFGDFFDGFKKVEKLAIASLLTTLVVLLACIPFALVIFAAGFSELFYEFIYYPEALLGRSEFFPFWIFLFLAPVIYISVAYSWVIPLIVFYEAEPLQALELSRRLITKQWWIIFAFLLVSGLFALLGVIVLLIGILFTLPLVFCAQYAAFADVTKLYEEISNEDDIIDHLVE